MRRKILLTLTLAILMMGFTMVQAQDTPASDGVALTVYNQGSALVQDRRTFTFDSGVNLLNFTDVASLIDATSVNFKSLTDPDGTSILEQNYVYDLVDVSALLERYVDETIRVTSDDGTIYEGILLSGRGGNIILQDANGEVVVVGMQNARDVNFPALPEGLITRPTLRWLLNANTAGENQVELTYLTGGMSWTADYNLLLATDNSQLDLNGWITLNNNSGTSYTDALLKLVAGDVNRLPDMNTRAVADDMDMVFMAEAAGAPPVEQREFFEYQLYEIGRPVSVGNNETKQVEFVSGANVPATTFYVYNASPAFYPYGPMNDQFYGQTGVTDVQNYLEFTTDSENGLGADLPAGRVRVYQQDIDGAALLIGENRIDHTPEGEDVQIYLGNAFDLVGERIQTNYVQLAPNVVEETYQITLRNRKDDEAVQIRVPETMFRWTNWEILSNDLPFESINSNTIEFRVDVPAGGEVSFSYTVRYTWQQ